MEEKDRIWKLFARKLAGEATAEELDELQSLLQKYPEIAYSQEVLAELRKPPGEPEEQLELQDAYAKHLRRMVQKQADTEFKSRFTQKTEITPSNSSAKSSFFFSSGSRGAIRNYLKVTRQNLLRNKAFSFINILGLAIGMASAVLILLWIGDELSYDQFHEKKDRIYEVFNRSVFDGQTQCWNVTPMVMGPVLKMDYAGVEESTRSNWVAAFILTVGETHVQAEGNVTDPGFLKMFSFPLLQGNANTALNATHSIVITEKLAKKLFNGTDVLGKTIKIDSNAFFTVTGVMKDLPTNTRFRFDYLVPWSYMKEVGWDNQSWGENSIVETFVMLKPGVTEKMANEHLRHIIQAHASDIHNEVFLHPLRKWRLWSNFENGKNTGGYIERVRLFAIIAAFILIIACINYMNLSTARSVKRAREVGIRKVMGAQKGSLVKQFLAESVLIAFISGIIALIIVQPSLTWFNWLTWKKLTIPYSSMYFWLGAIGFILITGIIAGSYPAFYLSAYKPIVVLKGTFKSVKTLATPRKMLVILQFTFAIIFIICTIVIYKQIAYGQNRDAGYNRNNLAFVYIKGDAQKNYPQIRDELLKAGVATAVTRTNSPIAYIWSWEDSFEWTGKDTGTRSFFSRFNAENDFTKTMEITLLAGRDINVNKYPTDSMAIMLNETAASLVGFKNPVGQEIKNNQGTWHIVGVIKNFIPGTPYEPVNPMVIEGPGPGPKNWYGTITFRLNDNYNISENLKKTEAIFKKYNPDYPFEYFYVENAYGERFQGDQRFGMLAAIFAGLTIFIACLGLFALAAYMAESRTKEIGVRKILGASVTAITTLLSGDFLKLVMIAFVIASPLAWWAMHGWLQNYSYHVNISGWVFVMTGLNSVLIALATVSYQAIKAALMKPVESLRTE